MLYYKLKLKETKILRKSFYDSHPRARVFTRLYYRDRGGGRGRRSIWQSEGLTWRFGGEGISGGHRGSGREALRWYRDECSEARVDDPATQRHARVRRERRGIQGASPKVGT